MPVEVEDAGRLLAEMFAGDAWRYVAQPALQRRLRWMTEQLAGNDRWDLETMRAMQAQIKLLRLMTENRSEFFRFGLEDDRQEK